MLRKHTMHRTIVTKKKSLSNCSIIYHTLESKKRASNELNGRVISNPNLPITRQNIFRLNPRYTRVATHLEPQFGWTSWHVNHIPHCPVGPAHGPPLLPIILHHKPTRSIILIMAVFITYNVCVQILSKITEITT